MDIPDSVNRLLLLRLEHEDYVSHVCVINRDETWLAQAASNGTLKIPAEATITQGFEVVYDPDQVVDRQFIVNSWLRDYAGDGEAEPRVTFTQAVCLRREETVWVDDQGGSEETVERTFLHRSSYDGHGIRIPLRLSPRLKVFFRD